MEDFFAYLIFDIDGVVRDVGGSYRRALADTVEHYTNGACRPTPTDIDRLKAEGLWNNDWEGSRELIYRYFEARGASRSAIALDYEALVGFFQSRYRGQNWDGYVASEPLLMDAAYLSALRAGGVAWGFFSGATRDSAEYVLKKRLGLEDPVLVAMEDAPGKPDPTGLFDSLERVAAREGATESLPAIYAGDTVADMLSVVRARERQPERCWLGAGILPPHVRETPERARVYSAQLREAGAQAIYSSIRELDAAAVRGLISTPQAIA